jgi:hypothetical protein
MAIKKTAKKVAKKVAKKPSKKATVKVTSKKAKKLAEDRVKAIKRVTDLIKSISEARPDTNLVWQAHTGQSMPKHLKGKECCIFTKEGRKSPPRDASDWDWKVDDNLGSIVAYAEVK